jgi:hypothetical protein
MNTNKSEEILNKITDDFFGNIIRELERLSKYDENTQSYMREFNVVKEFYNPHTYKYEDQTLEEILDNYRHINIINHTGSLNKAKIMAIIQ